MTNFYKKDGSYFTSDTNAKIPDVAALNALSKAGGKEITAPSTPTPPVPVIDTAIGQGTFAKNKNNGITSSTISAGLTTGGISSNLPNSNTEAQKIYTDKTINDANAQSATLTNQLNEIKATQLKQAENDRKQAESDLKTIQDQKQSEINSYDVSMQPLKDQAQSQYKTMLDSISGVDYKSLVDNKVSLTNDIISYSRMMRDELDQEASRPSLLSVSQGRQNSVKENYTSKIATSQAAIQAIDGNFSLAFDIMDKGANAINQLNTNRINFLNMVKGIYDTKESNANTKLINITTDEKKLIDNAITDLESKIKNVETNKQTIQKLMEENPIIANKANLLLTDTPEQITTKLNSFYVKNPQFTKENQEWIKKAMDKYFDAGINLNDSIETVRGKIQNSKIFDKDNSGKFTMSTDPITGETKVFNSTTGDVTVVPATGTIGGQCGDYIHKVLDNVPAVGDTVASKKKAMNMTASEFYANPQVGDVVAFNIGKNGHVAIVIGVDGDKVTVNESNYNLDGKVGNRTISTKDPTIIGAYRGGTLKDKTPTESSPAITSWVNQIKAGKATISNVPANLKTAVISAMDKETNGQTSEAGSLKDNALNSAKELLRKFTSGEGTSAVGKSRLFYPFGTIPGTAPRNFEIQYNNLKSLLSLDNVKYLKGQGQVSDAERKLLSEASAKLDLAQSEEEFKKALEEIVNSLSGQQSTSNKDNPTPSADIYRTKYKY